MKRINPRENKVFLFEPDGSCVETFMVSSKSYMFLDLDKSFHPAWVDDEVESLVNDSEVGVNHFHKMKVLTN
uniref:Ribosomal protein L31 n=1 Tax=Ophirina amphinema TaxID=2108040 RepID=A0A348AYV5_9EUKA|nr:ribosomal protein L31 [Ophirina amphinema]